MDQTQKRDLAMVERHLAQGQRLQMQDEMIARLKHHGLDTTEAEAFRERIENFYPLHLDHRDRLLGRLATSHGK